MREKIEALLFQQVGGKVEYQKMDLFYFPRPGVKAHQVTLSIDEKVAGTVKSVQVYPELPALLRGKLRVARIEVESPDFAIQVPMGLAEVKEKPEGAALKEFEEIVARVAVIVPRLKVVMKDGRLNLVKGSKTVLSFNDIDANMTGPPREAKIEITCRSILWERMSAEATINPVGLTGHGHIETASFHPHLLSGFLSPNSPLNVIDSEMNLNIDFEAKGQRMFQAALEGSVSKLIFEEGSQETTIRGRDFRGAFQMEGGRIDISLGELNLEYPRLALSGRFKIDQKTPLLLMEIQGRELDVTSTREVTLRLAGKIPVMNTIFEIVRAGRIPLITFQSHGRRVSDLDDTERFSIKGNMLDGKISIPVRDARGNREDLTFEKVTGDVVISRGILEGRNVWAQWKNQPLQEGRVRVGLEGEDAPLHAEVGFETDLSILPPLLNRMSKDRGFLEEMARLRQIEGRAAGRLVLGESLKSIEVKADVQEVNLVARHDRIPYPVEIVGGAFSFDGKRLRLRNLSGKVGNSSFLDLSAQIGIEKDPFLEISSGRSVISLDDLYPWLSSYEVLRDGLKKIQSVKGNVTLSGMRLSGPLMRPGKWDFETMGELKGLIVSTSLLPEPFTVSSGKFTLYPQKIMTADLQTKFLSASLNVSGALYDYQRGLQRAELSLSGRVTPKDVQWLSNALDLKSKVQLRSSVGISQAQFSWRKGVDVGLRGNLAVQNGPEITLDLLRHSHGIKINHLRIRDDISDASIQLDVKGQVIDLTFSGSLSERTLDNIFSGYPFHNGWLKGDFRANILMNQWMRSKFQGRLEADHLSFPWQFEKPLKIDHLSLMGEENHVSIAEARFAWGEMPFVLSGDVGFSEKRVLLDVALSTERVDVDQVTQSLSKEKSAKGARGLPNLQAEGTIRFKSNSVTYGRFTWEPFRANIAVGHNAVEVSIEEAKLCGISTTGAVKVTDKKLSLDVRPVSESAELESKAKCLLDETARVTGDFELKGRIFAEAEPKDLIPALRGNLEFKAKSGRIDYLVGLARILEFVNLTEIYKGKIPDMKKEGLSYKLATVIGSLQDGKLIIKEGTLDGHTLQMAAQGEIDLAEGKIDLTVLVAPLRTVDRIINLIPLVRYIFAGSLLSLPVKVSGDLKDPKVTALSPSAIGSELLGMMKRTLGLPFKVIEPLMPRKKEDNSRER
jgi:hypothetical protein